MSYKVDVQLSEKENMPKKFGKHGQQTHGQNSIYVNDWLTYWQNEECTGGRTGLRKDKVNNQVDLLLKSLTKEDYARTINEINWKS